MLDQIKAMNAELAQLKAVHLEKSKSIFTEVSAKIFEKHSILESFGWNQYTPYYNDGEECVFSVNTDYPLINGENYNDATRETIYEKHGTDYKEVPNPKYNAALAEAEKDVKNFLAEMDEAVLRDMFGDHRQITVTRTGTEVEEYEHD